MAPLAATVVLSLLVSVVPVSPLSLITAYRYPSAVRVELYYESLCPACRNFITEMLFPTFGKLIDTGIMEVV